MRSFGGFDHIFFFYAGLFCSSPTMAVHPDPTWFLNHQDPNPIITVLPNAKAPPTANLLHFNQLHDLDFNVRRALVEGLDYARPNQIQSSCLPLICRPPYDSLLVQARPGCGTSMVVAISLMNRINTDLRAPQSLCLVPTRATGVKVKKFELMLRFSITRVRGLIITCLMALVRLFLFKSGLLCASFYCFPNRLATITSL